MSTIETTSQSIRFFPIVTAKSAVMMATALAFVIFLTTLQLDINGSPHPYTTDVGEIQNALPRWGTIHFSGYPLYTALGSAFVSLLRLLAIPPAAGASLYSAVWGAITIALLVNLILAFEVPPAAAAITALLFGLSTSMWIDSSLAEVHTMTMALTIATLWVALRFGRAGDKSDLYWLAFLSGQGLAHQRAFAFLGLGLLVLVIRQWRVILGNLPAALGLALLGPLTYLYIPLQLWAGTDWVFNTPSFWALVSDTKAERIIALPESAAEWGLRLEGVFNLLALDWPWPLLLLGILGLLFAGRGVHWRERLALALSWLPYLVVSLIIWEGRVSDALLAVKMPIVALAAVGIAFISQSFWHRRAGLGQASVVVWLLMAAVLVVAYRPTILEITRNQQAYETIALVDQIPPAADGRPSTFTALWGNDYWQLAYAKAYQNKLSHLNVVDHEQDFASIAAQSHLLTFSHTFYQRRPEWWQEQFGSLHLSYVAPGIIEISPQPQLSSPSPDSVPLGNGIAIQHATLSWTSPDTLLVSIAWQAQQAELPNYSVATHLLAQSPPTGPQDIITQADRKHPVDGWYPTSHWVENEIVHDHYLLPVPPQSTPIGVRIGMYQVLDDGQFQNSEWLFLPVEQKQ